MFYLLQPQSLTYLRQCPQPPGAALIVRFAGPSIRIIRHENGAFLKLPLNRKLNLKTPAFRFHVTHIENGAF